MSRCCPYFTYSMYHEFDHLISSLSAPESDLTLNIRSKYRDTIFGSLLNKLQKIHSSSSQTSGDAVFKSREERFVRSFSSRGARVDRSDVEARASRAIIDIYEICQFTISAIISMMVICTNVLVTRKPRFRITVTREWNTLVFRISFAISYYKWNEARYKWYSKSFEFAE